MVMQARPAAGACSVVTIAAKLAFRTSPELRVCRRPRGSRLREDFKPLCQAPRSSVDCCDEAEACSCLATRNPSYHRYCPVVKEREYESVCDSYCVSEHVGLNL